MSDARVFPRAGLALALCAGILALAGMAAVAAEDASAGKALHDRHCVACHAARYGGDGSKIYLRPERMIHDRQALRQRVAFCATQTDAGWFPEDEDNVTAYLAQRYYKFDGGTR